MTQSRNKFYALLLITCLAGYIWLYFALTKHTISTQAVEVCLLKHVSNIPCPSCGSTRSVISIFQGSYYNALQLNPFGYLIVIIMLMAPLWITVDLARKKKTFFEFYKKIELNLARPYFAIPLFVLVLANWIWNITKGI